MNYIIIALIVLILIAGYIIYNLTTKSERLEKIVDDQNSYIERLSDLIELSNKKIKDSNIAEAFKTDDEVGFFFETLEEIQDQLNSFRTRNN